MVIHYKYNRARKVLKNTIYNISGRVVSDIYKLEPKARGCMSAIQHGRSYCKVLVIRMDVNVRICRKP